MNRCPDARALLPEYAEGELSPLVARRLEGHLALCAACRQEDAQFRAAFSALHAPRELAPHRDLRSGLNAKLARFERGTPVRPLQLRWAAAACLVLVAAGASAAYMRAILPHRQSIDPREAVVATPSSMSTGRRVAVNPQPTAKGPEVKFDFKSEPAAPQKKEPLADPFDKTRVAQADSGKAALTPAADNARESSGPSHKGPRRSAAATDREDFLGVRPLLGPSAEAILVQKRREVAVAQYAAPQPIEDAAHESDVNPGRIRPFIEAANSDSRSPGTPSVAHKPVSIADSEISEVMVDGKPADVQTSVGYDKRGRPVLVKVNIALKPIREKIDPDK